jgi:hypothetical protein
MCRLHARGNRAICNWEQFAPRGQIGPNCSIIHRRARRQDQDQVFLLVATNLRAQAEFNPRAFHGVVAAPDAPVYRRRKSPVTRASGRERPGQSSVHFGEIRSVRFNCWLGFLRWRDCFLC